MNYPPLCASVHSIIIALNWRKYECGLDLNLNFIMFELVKKSLSGDVTTGISTNTNREKSKFSKRNLSNDNIVIDIK